MKFLVDRDPADTLLLRKICIDTLCIDVIEKTNSNLFCGVYIEGRNREINTIEDEAAFRSFKIFSQNNYPYFVLSPNGENLFNNNPEYKKSRAYHIKIPELNSHDSYSQFMIKHLWDYIPEEFHKILFFHPDGFLIKEGWEQFVLDGQIDYIGSAWCHTPRIEILHEGQWKLINLPAIQCGNGGFSFRNRLACEEISKNFSHFTMREYGRTDNRPPPEDLFYSHLINGTVKNSRVAGLKDCMKFSLDPLTLQEYNKKASFGFHHPKKINEFQNYRDYFLNL
jgi:hypothetical protein